MSDYKNLSELLVQPVEVLVIDMLEHVLAVDEFPYLTSLVKPQPGIYFVGSIEPVISAAKKYYPKSQYLNPNAVIDKLANVFKSKEDIVDDTGKLILSYHDIKTKSRYMKLEPVVPVSGIKLAIGLVLNYLNSLCPYTNVANVHYQPETLINHVNHDLLHTGKYEDVFERLLDTVFTFVGKDTWHIYFYRVKGTTLIIEKMIDYRIYSWYQSKFESDEDKQE